MAGRNGGERAEMQKGLNSFDGRSQPKVRSSVAVASRKANGGGLCVGEEVLFDSGRTSSTLKKSRLGAISVTTVIIALCLGFASYTGLKTINDTSKMAAVPICQLGDGRSLDRLSAGINRLGAKLASQLDTPGNEENLFFSPVSVSSALAILRIGVTPGTSAEKELEAAVPCAQQVLEKIQTEIVGKREGNVDVQSANSLWARESVRRAYAKKLAQLGAHVAGMPSSPTPINDWVSSKTNGMIKQIVNAIRDDDVALLANALYFVGSWASKFDPDQTTDGTFNLADGTTTKCRMMFRSDRFPFLELPDKSQMIKMSYGRTKDFAAVIMMPSSDMSAAKALEAMGSSRFTSKRLNLKLPRFKLEYSSSLKPALQSAGVEAVFSQEGTLNGLSESPKVIVSDVSHKAVLEVDEAGTKAAAATFMQIRATAMDVSKPVDFVVDRPFYFGVQDRSGLMLFFGHVKNPTFT